MESVKLRVTAKSLAKQHGIEAAHSLYRGDGHWYHLLKKFPGVLFDANGYVRFETSHEYEACAEIRRYEEKEQAFVRDGISKLPRYKLFTQG